MVARWSMQPNEQGLQKSWRPVARRRLLGAQHDYPTNIMIIADSLTLLGLLSNFFLVYIVHSTQFLTPVVQGFFQHLTRVLCNLIMCIHVFFLSIQQIRGCPYLGLTPISWNALRQKSNLTEAAMAFGTKSCPKVPSSSFSICFVTNPFSCMTLCKICLPFCDE